MGEEVDEGRLEEQGGLVDRTGRDYFLLDEHPWLPVWFNPVLWGGWVVDEAGKLMKGVKGSRGGVDGEEVGVGGEVVEEVGKGKRVGLFFPNT